MVHSEAVALMNCMLINHSGEGKATPGGSSVQSVQVVVKTSNKFW
jgi:hypothetical protein